MTIKAKIEMDPRVQLKLRRTLDGKIMIFDHEDMDIVISAENKKCVSFPKDQLTDKCYQSQDRMYKYLVKRGVIDPSTVRGGNIHGSLEAALLEVKIPGIDPIQACLYAINEYLNSEKPFFRGKDSEQFSDDRLASLLMPSPEDSTELGDVPHSDRKGSHGFTRGPYGFMYNYSLVREHKNKEEEECS